MTTVIWDQKWGRACAEDWVTKLFTVTGYLRLNRSLKCRQRRGRVGWVDTWRSQNRVGTYTHTVLLFRWKAQSWGYLCKIGQCPLHWENQEWRRTWRCPQHMLASLDVDDRCMEKSSVVGYYRDSVRSLCRSCGVQEQCWVCMACCELLLLNMAHMVHVDPYCIQRHKFPPTDPQLLQSSSRSIGNWRTGKLICTGPAAFCCIGLLQKNIH